MTSQYLSFWRGRLASSWLCGSRAAPPLSSHLLLSLLLAISWLQSHRLGLGFVKEADGGSFLRLLMTVAAAIGFVYVEGRPERG